MVGGVLPVPPTLTLPITITGTGSRRWQQAQGRHFWRSGRCRQNSRPVVAARR